MHFFIIRQQKLCRNVRKEDNFIFKQNNNYTYSCVIYAIKNNKIIER